MWTFHHCCSEYCYNCRGFFVPWSKPFGTHPPFSHTLQCLAYMGTGSNNHLKLRLASLVLKFLLPVLRECQMWVCLDNIVKVKYISHCTLHAQSYCCSTLPGIIEHMPRRVESAPRRSVPNLWKVWQGIQKCHVNLLFTVLLPPWPASLSKCVCSASQHYGWHLPKAYKLITIFLKGTRWLCPKRLREKDACIESIMSCIRTRFPRIKQALNITDPPPQS